LNKAWRILIPLLTLAICLGLLRSVFFWGYVPSSSMEPTIQKGSIIFGYRRFGELKTGDIIIFCRNGRLLIKRIAACGGDTISIGDDSILVPDASFYVLGDNAEDSLDSRYWSDPFVPLDDVVAKLIL
jgi:signal peptidase I